MTLWDQMQWLYRKYGCYKESLHTLVKTGEEGIAEITGLMERLRRTPLRSFGEVKTVEFADYLYDRVIRLCDGREIRTGLPKSDVLYYELKDDNWVCIRPSGTEPKIKVYIGTRGATEQEAEERLSVIWEAAAEELGLI